MLKRIVMLCMLVLLAQLFMACSSVPKVDPPLWIEESKVEQIFPHKEYVTGVAHAGTEELARTLAEAMCGRELKDHNIYDVSSAEVDGHLPPKSNGLIPSRAWGRAMSGMETAL